MLAKTNDQETGHPDATNRSNRRTSEKECVIQASFSPPATGHKASKIERAEDGSGPLQLSGQVVL